MNIRLYQPSSQIPIPSPPTVGARRLDSTTVATVPIEAPSSLNSVESSFSSSSALPFTTEFTTDGYDSAENVTATEEISETTTDIPTTQAQELSDEASVTLPSLINSMSSEDSGVLSMEMQSNIKENDKKKKSSTVRVISQRYTQPFNGPMILERHLDDQHIPLYYDTLSLHSRNNDVDNTNIPSYAQRAFLAAMPAPFIIFPISIPIPAPFMRTIALNKVVPKRKSYLK